MDAVRLCGEAVKKTAEATADKGGLGCAKLVIFANAVEDNPFMAARFTAWARAIARSAWATAVPAW
jgi:uncharacterized protein (UPF0210 family)